MTKIFVTRTIPDEGLKMLKARKSVKVDVYLSDEKIPRDVLLKRVKGANVILSILTDKIDGEVMDAAGSGLKMVANYAVGFDNIDLQEAKKRGIVVTNAPGPEITETVAEHTIALMFALAHRIVETDAFARAGKYVGWGPMLLLGADVCGKTIGIIGGGQIGGAVMRRMHDGFDAKLVYHDIRRNPEVEKKYGAKYRTLPQLLKEADFVSLHVPLLPSTRHLIGAKELKMMRKTAFLINTARGPVIDELALTKALARKEIAGAGLDVFECEPQLDCNPKDTYELRKLPNVILTPHTGSATVATRQAIGRTAAKNILAFLDGKKVPNQVKI